MGCLSFGTVMKTTDFMMETSSPGLFLNTVIICTVGLTTIGLILSTVCSCL